MTLRDLPEAAAPGPVADVGSLLSLAAELPALTTRPQVLEALLAGARRVSGADRAAVLERTALDGLRRIEEHRSGLPESLVIGDVRAALWSVLLGRAQLVWGEGEQAPVPFTHIDGWDRGVVLRIASQRGHTKLLALGGASAIDPAVLTSLQAMADIAAPSIESLELRESARRSQGLLRGVTELAGNLGAAVSPTQLLEAVVQGLHNLDGIAGAVVWGGQDGGPDVPEVIVSAGPLTDGFPSQVRTRVERLLDPGTKGTARALVSTAARAVPGGPLMTLMTWSAEPPRVLGIVHEQPLDDLSQGVLASLVAAAGPAMREVEMAAERRSLLSSYTDALRPSTRPMALEVAIEHHPNTNAPGSFGGDFYDWFDVADDHSLVALGDVSGKGISAASAASMVVWSLRAVGGRGAQPTVVSHLLNSIVARELDDDRFVTLALVTVDSAAWEARVLLAGHPSPVLLNGVGATFVEGTPSPPLGVSPIASVAPPTLVPLEPGDALVLFTDGVTEALGPQREQYGPQRLLSRASELASTSGWTAGSIASDLWADVRSWAGGPPDDDCAILVLRRPG
jgi:phosphoserine phosphatase RsbU/P